jgi:hypothetical protein
LWKWGAERLNPARKLHWQVLRLYPKSQPNPENTIRSRRRLWTSGDAGWLHDARRSVVTSGSQLTPRSGVGDRVEEEGFALRENLAFSDWINITAEIEARDTFDPRCGEWTALELFRQILLKAKEGTNLANPYNIKFNLRLLNASNPATWEDWRSVCTEDNVNVEDTGIYDYRLLFTTIPHNSESSYVPVTYGILLKMLLSRTLDIPDTWNLPGLTGARLGSIFGEVEQLAVSSATNAVLEQCLAPRFIEYRSAAQKTGAVAQDAVRRRLLKIAKAVSNAQETLVLHQVTIRAHKPRQLIPVCIFQLRSQFSDLVEDSEA